MAELYHLHLKGNHDEKWKAKKELTITDDFNNRLGKRINGFSDCTIHPKFKAITDNINQMLQQNGYRIFPQMPIHVILEYVLNPNNKIDPQTQRLLLEEARKIALETSIFKREIALEEFRKSYNPELPSRMHCVYATTENGIAYWVNLLKDNDLDILKIETLEDPFKTDEQFIPMESLNYREMYENSLKYWHPKSKNISEESAEYLIKGRIKILEKVDEIKRHR